jgi:hypothetical protein
MALALLEISNDLNMEWRTCAEAAKKTNSFLWKRRVVLIFRALPSPVHGLCCKGEPDSGLRVTRP